MSNIKTLEMGEAIKEYMMPYAMKTIIDRALPDVRDGLKPIHRRILYKMYELKLFHNKPKMKCHPLVGKVLEIHNHGDSSVYDALARLTEQNESLLHAYIEGEGGFGKVYDTDNPSAPRYTFARLNKFALEMFDGLEKNVVDFIGDDHKQPVVLPNTYPNILVKNNKGMSVGFSCDFPSYNLSKLCDATTVFIKNPEADIFHLMEIDFPTGGYLINDEKELRKIYESGKGSIVLRAKYRFDGKHIEIYEIPYNTTATAIIKKIDELLSKKDNKFKEIVDVRNESDFNTETDKEELKIAIEVKKNTDVERLMKRLYRHTPLESTMSCAMICLVNYKPKTIGVKEILSEWLKFRKECIKKSIQYDCNKKEVTLHHLKALQEILLDVDKAIKIIRETSKESEVVNNLMKSFNIDEKQAEYISDIKLRNLNKEYIMKRTEELVSLEKEIENLKGKLSNDEEISNIIIDDLQRIKKQYGKPRKTEVIDPEKLSTIDTKEVEIEDYNIKVFVTAQGYLKKVPATSLRGNSQHKLKDNDIIVQEFDSTNKSELLIFTSSYNCYKVWGYELDDHKLSVLGDYLPSLLQLEKDEKVLFVGSTTYTNEKLIIMFENGKLAKINVKDAFETSTNRKKLAKAFSDKSKPVFWKVIKEDIDLVAQSSIDKVLLFNTSLVAEKSTRSSQGNQIMKSKDDSKVIGVYELDQCQFEDAEYYRGNTNAVGKYLKKTDSINN